MATTTTQIPRETWRAYFQELTQALGTVEATVEVVGRDVGDQFPAEHYVLTDVAYDEQSDAFVVALDTPGTSGERKEFRIERPQRVLVATGEPPPLEVTFDIEDGDGHQWLIRVERPPALPGE